MHFFSCVRQLPGAINVHCMRERISYMALLAVLACMQSPFAMVRAEEPIEKFLSELRERRLFSLATIYLEQQGKLGLLTPSMQADLPLEKTLLLQASLVAVRTVEDREKRIAEIEKGFEEFLKKSPNHPRRSEAKLQLADTFLTRGQELLLKIQKKEATDDDRQQARKAFESASKLFENTLTELRPILESMQGNRVSADDTVKTQLRSRLQEEYRRAEILQAQATKYTAETFLPEQSEYKTLLEKSEKLFSELIKKTPGAKEAGPHTLSLLYRGQVQALLGKVDEAQDSFFRVADITEAGVFRDWRVQATTDLIELLTTPPQNKYEAVLARAQVLLKDMQANERMQPNWIALQLATAEAQTAWSAILDSQDGGKPRARTERKLARETLQGLVRRPGPHVDKARELLSALGVEANTKEQEDKIPEIKSFEVGLAEAQKRLDEVQNLELSREIASQDNPEAEGKIREDILKLVDQSEKLLKQGISLFKSGNDREQLLKARYFLAFVYLKQQKYWESAAMADFVSQVGMGTDTGLAAGSTALFSYSKLYDLGDSSRKSALLPPLESLARRMVDSSPGTPASEKAVLTLVSLALSNKQWDEADRFVALLPEKSSSAGPLLLDMGYIHWNRYLMAMEDRRKSDAMESQEDKDLLVRAEKVLEQGVKTLTPDNLSPRAIEASNALISIYLRSGRIDQAEALLNRESTGSLAVIRSGSEVVSDSGIRLQTLRLHLQSQVLAATQDAARPLDASVVEKTVREMESAAEGSPEGKEKLSKSLVALASDLRTQFSEAKDPMAQTRLAETIALLLKQIAQVSTNPSLLESAGSTMLEIGDVLSKQPSTQAQAKLLYQAASHTLQRVLELGIKDPAFSSKLPSVRNKSARAARGQGNFEMAIQQFSDFLASNNAVLSVQEDAARTLQEWGDATQDKQYYTQAMVGAEKLPNGENKIWGWGALARKISSQLKKNPELRSNFFNARYQLAQCRLGAAKTSKDKQTELLELALGDIRTTVVSYPDLGDPATKTRFDELARSIQRSLGKPEVGLQEFK